MDVRATTKYARIAPRKARSLARAIQGLPVTKALEIVQFSERKAALFLAKTLRSAVANAENNAQLSAETLCVKEAVIEEGPVFARHWPRARGMVSPIRKRTSHVKIVLTDSPSGAKRRRG